MVVLSKVQHSTEIRGRQTYTRDVIMIASVSFESTGAGVAVADASTNVDTVYLLCPRKEENWCHCVDLG